MQIGVENMGNKYIKWTNTNGQWHRIVDVSTDPDPTFLDYIRNNTLERELVRKAEEQLKKEAEIRMRVWNSHSIKNVIFNDPATIVFWYDGTKTVVKCQPGDTYDKRMGLALCIAKKALGNKGNYNNVFDKWIPEEPEQETKQETKSKYKVGDRVRFWAKDESRIGTIVYDDGSGRMQYIVETKGETEANKCFYCYESREECMDYEWYIEGLADG